MCNNTFNSPNGIEQLVMLNRKCEEWAWKGRGEVKLFKLEFYTDYWTDQSIHELLPNDDNTSGEFW
jgi:hypothetical protein